MEVHIYSLLLSFIEYFSQYIKLEIKRIEKLKSFNTNPLFLEYLFESLLIVLESYGRIYFKSYTIINSENAS